MRALLDVRGGNATAFVGDLRLPYTPPPPARRNRCDTASATPGMTRSTRSASTRRLTFVPTAADAPPARDPDLTVVLDAAWTPQRGGRADVRSVRSYFGEVVEGHDLPGEALVALDRWAAAVGAADHLVVEEV